MIVENISIQNRHGEQLHRRRWVVKDRVKACIIIVHGLAEHSARYNEFATFCAERGYAVCALDLPGHGRSEGDRCSISRFSRYTESVDDLLSKVKDEYPSIPLFLLGHSMGGLITCHLLVQRQRCFSGAILSSPALIATDDLNSMQMLALRVLARLLPNFGAMKMDPEGVSRDSDVVNAYMSDPLNYHGKVCARTLLELYRAVEIADRFNEIELPLLILHGGSDSMATPEGSKRLYTNSRSTDKELHIYPGLFHEILNEPEREMIFTQIVDWMEKHREFKWP